MLLASGTIHGMEYALQGLKAFATKAMQSPSIIVSFGLLSVPWLYAIYNSEDREQKTNHLFDAIKTNPATALEIVEQGDVGNLEARDIHGNTPLLLAIKQGLSAAKKNKKSRATVYANLVTTLLHAGAKKTAQDNNGKKADDLIGQMYAYVAGEMKLSHEIEDSFLFRAAHTMLKESK